jgi:hypothetical protein
MSVKSANRSEPPAQISCSALFFRWNLPAAQYAPSVLARRFTSAFRCAAGGFVADRGAVEVLPAKARQPGDVRGYPGPQLRRGACRLQG